jgi:hypothetical protein
MVMDEKLPTRLLYVSDNGQSVRLCITRDIESDKGNIKYTALTHCWGVSRIPVLTTQENIKQMLCHIHVSSLTKTFQDAIIITRQLGLQYLWIDSLCIIQGDKDDWASESATMANVYAGCTVNIVAAAASEGSVGCLFSRHHAPEYGFKAYVRAEARQKGREL